MIEGYGKGVKYSLLATNTIIFLTGLTMVALGVWSVSDRVVVERLLGINLYIASAIILIITGTVVAVISLLGSLGAYKELRSMLKSYFFILLALLSLIVLMGSVGYVFRIEMDDKLQREMNASMKLYGNDSRVTEAWDSMQLAFECCGVAVRSGRSFESWRRESPRFNATSEGPLVPVSCCRSLEEDATRRSCQGRQPRKEDTWTDGCYDKMIASIRDHKLIIILSVSFAVLFILTGLVLSGVLFYLIGRKREPKVLEGIQ